MWDPVQDSTVFALSVRILAGRTFSNFSASLPGMGDLPTDDALPLILPASDSAAPLPSPPLAQPPIFVPFRVIVHVTVFLKPLTLLSRVSNRDWTHIYMTVTTSAQRVQRVARWYAVISVIWFSMLLAFRRCTHTYRPPDSRVSSVLLSFSLINVQRTTAFSISAHLSSRFLLLSIH